MRPTIRSQPERQKDTEAIGAKVAIGSIEDVNFLTKTFTGADAVYFMLPPFKFQQNPNLDARAEALRLSKNYTKAIQQSGVKRVVHLSSIGAHLEKGNGILGFHFYCRKSIQEVASRDSRYTHAACWFLLQLI